MQIYVCYMYVYMWIVYSLWCKAKCIDFWVGRNLLLVSQRNNLKVYNTIYSDGYNFRNGMQFFIVSIGLKPNHKYFFCR